VRALLAAGLLQAPAFASACSSCARDGSRFGQLLIAAMALFPTVVAGVVVGVVRHASAARANASTPEARP
jgi:F0F1-type ATP synthase membrane subunit c/vacuolar-type H+-ATPase subunit K